MLLKVFLIKKDYKPYFDKNLKIIFLIKWIFCFLNPHELIGSL